MAYFNFFSSFFGGLVIAGSERGDLIFGAFGDDVIAGNDGDDLILGLFGDDKLSGGAGEDIVFGAFGDDTAEGGDGDDHLFGGVGDDVVVGNKGNDRMFGGHGDDTLVWNNGDGSDLMNGGRGHDRVQVNFDTDLVNDDLQNKDVAAFSVTDQGVQFARIAVNDQTEVGLFQLDIRKTEVLETNFGGGDDSAVILGDVLDRIALDLDGGAGVDTLDLGQAASAIDVDLALGTLGTSTAIDFENVVGTAFDETIAGDARNNLIRGGAGDDVMSGGAGADTFVFFEEDEGVDVILDFDFQEDTLLFVTSNPDVTTANLLGNLTQVGEDVELTLDNKAITFENTNITEFYADDFMIA